ncbi:hypothetical protein B9G69_005725 [Bdellovibrio sp. SKB1291214]|uniref:hypothetical protein n=1 Tax=Bdellovibrio sp. SKB1291214 TaxID=1732569 RepID=UPI00223F73BE|nr:hypothetical protein [Bdellovibrio sp. SKB1291214]UYL10075.1 hypothetical protein B9G69_005725 [Bdellovibrio sp. SKB1291214]
MKQIILLYLLPITFLMLSACVEIRDKNEENTPIKIKSLSSVVIDEPYILVRGELVPRRDFPGAFSPDPKAIADQTIYQLNFDHLLIKENGAIYTMGANLQMNVNELDALGGIISTFPTESTLLNISGSGGGNFKLNVSKARGRLGIHWRGAKGKEGPKGAPPTEGMRGQYKELGLGGDYPSYQCVKGEKGFPGYPGLPGGNSGKVFIEIVDAQGLDLQRSILGGEGGEGGPGGDGGEPQASCQEAGPIGDRGPRGPAGETQTICVKLGDAVPDCKFE